MCLEDENLLGETEADVLSSSFSFSDFNAIHMYSSVGHYWLEYPFKRILYFSHG